jgi:hypothetical protein
MASKLKVNFGVEVPSSTRESRYQELYDLLKANKGQWADVTDAISALAQAQDAKVPTPQASAITLRKQGFEATTRQVDGEPRVFAAFEPDGDTEAEQGES